MVGRTPWRNLLKSKGIRAIGQLGPKIHPMRLTFLDSNALGNPRSSHQLHSDESTDFGLEKRRIKVSPPRTIMIITSNP